MEHLTVENITAFLVILGYLVAGLKWLAPRTTFTQVDDKVVSSIEKAEAWAFNVAPHIWPVIEELHLSGKIEAAKKPVSFLMELREAYRNAYGAKLPKSAEEIAKTVVKGISKDDKLNKLIQNVNPRPAQASPAT
ncbi:MAG: hypothetical protein HQM10_03965 [Candidatus Riflebacteria bacterium]|nr:hypothetical protein [Candidatus Riflebacteria bacterium]